MATSNQLVAGMIIAVNHRVYEVESCAKVGGAKGSASIKVQLRDLATNQILEKQFKPNQQIQDVVLHPRHLEYLYLEEDHFLCLDFNTLDTVMIPEPVIGEHVKYLKEGIEFSGLFHGDQAVAIELPQFLELMVAKIVEVDRKKQRSDVKLAVLETGAEVSVPPFISVGDVIKVDTQSGEYIQRV